MSDPERPGPGASSLAEVVERRRLRVTGTVQGVGFRPFVYRNATRLGLSGEVGNDAGGVTIEVEGPTEALDGFVATLLSHPPPLAAISTIEASSVEPTGARGFEIVASQRTTRVEAPIPVDVGPCEACLTELEDPADRRYRYPFINCTDCGPRYTITRRVPYDRPWTTMAPFAMCHACQTEYEDPGDRRFHAQPNACAACGPRLILMNSDGIEIGDGGQALATTLARLVDGDVVAVKGVGGYHLAVSADDQDAVLRLRERKARDDKPFALLVSDVDAARELVVLDHEAAVALASPRRPIVLAPRRDDGSIADAVAPGLPELGVMLPPSPLHHLVATGVARPLVLTSGNLSDEPIAYTDDDAVERLGSLVDAILTHDREIHVRCDDSVLRVDVAGGLQPVRRSRGMAPQPLELPPGCDLQTLAVGAESKSTIAVTRGGRALLSHHLGDLEHPAAHRAFLEAVDHLLRVHEVVPEVIAHDLHPEYLSTKFADELDLPRRPIQHHHAHVAACLAEHGETGPVFGLVLDGLGWGTDGTAWGGELLMCDLDRSERVGHLRPVALPGGDAAVREPWRMAVSWATEVFGPDAVGEIVGDLDPRWAQVRDVVTSGQAVMTSSAGRLFDAVAALLGIRSRVSYEGQAAIELEAAAGTVALGSPSAHGLAPVVVAERSGMLVLDPSSMLSDLVAGRRAGLTRSTLAAAFHASLAVGLVEVVVEAASRRDLDTTALSGGVFQNVRLTALVGAGLRAAGLRVLVHRRVPPNDGGISFGQAAIAARADPPA